MAEKWRDRVTKKQIGNIMLKLQCQMTALNVYIACSEKPFEFAFILVKLIATGHVTTF